MVLTITSAILLALGFLLHASRRMRMSVAPIVVSRARARLVSVAQLSVYNLDGGRGIVWHRRVCSLRNRRLPTRPQKRRCARGGVCEWHRPADTTAKWTFSGLRADVDHFVAYFDRPSLRVSAGRRPASSYCRAGSRSKRGEPRRSFGASMRSLLGCTPEICARRYRRKIKTGAAAASKASAKRAERRQIAQLAIGQKQPQRSRAAQKKLIVGASSAKSLI